MKAHTFVIVHEYCLLFRFVCRCVRENGQKRRFRCRIGMDSHIEWLFPAIAAGGAGPSFRVLIHWGTPLWGRFRLTDRPGSGGFAGREDGSRSGGGGRLDLSANRSFRRRTCSHSRAGFPCQSVGRRQDLASASG